MLSDVMQNPRNTHHVRPGRYEITRCDKSTVENGICQSTFAKSRDMRTEISWEMFSSISVEDALNSWQETLNGNTRESYGFGIKRLIEIGLIDPTISLQEFSMVNHESVIDRIKQFDGWKEASKQARAACYISFTGFLHRKDNIIFQKAIACRDGVSKTFYKIRHKVKTNAMNNSQWIKFFECLHKINSRDCLLAKIILQGGKRLDEVLNMSVDQIDWHKNMITFLQSKSRGVEKFTYITYRQQIMDDLKNYINNRDGLVFVTCTGNKICKNQLSRSFSKAGEMANIPFKVTPHVLRASTVTYLKQQGFCDSDIMKVTGHSSAEMINAYDKSELCDNATNKINLV